MKDHKPVFDHIIYVEVGWADKDGDRHVDTITEGIDEVVDFLHLLNGELSLEDLKP